LWWIVLLWVVDLWGGGLLIFEWWFMVFVFEVGLLFVISGYYVCFWYGLCNVYGNVKVFVFVFVS